MFGFSVGARAHAAALIDIGSASVGGAVCVLPKNGAPIIPFSIREAIEELPNGRKDVAMLRAFETVLQKLESEGRAALQRTHLNHTLTQVIVAIDAPWQTTQVETKTILNDKPFVFTHEVMAKVQREKETLPEEKRELRREVMATLLNGYHTEEPYGKRAERADIVLLTSQIDADTLHIVGNAGKRLGVRTKTQILPIQLLSQQVLRAQYPHDKDFLLMLVTGEATDILFAKQGIIMDAKALPVGLQNIRSEVRSGMRSLPVQNEDGPAPTAPTVLASPTHTQWSLEVTQVLKDFATRRALPRIIFLVANDGSAETLKKLLDTHDMHGLWLSDEPLRLIPVVSKLLSSLIRHQGEANLDVTLDLIALFAELEVRKGAL